MPKTYLHMSRDDLRAEALERAKNLDLEGKPQEADFYHEVANALEIIRPKIRGQDEHE